MSSRSQARGEGGPARTHVGGWAVSVATAGTLAIAAGAFWLSFTTLEDLAARSGIASSQAWIWPLIVDGCIVVATVAVVALHPFGRRATIYPWALLVAGASVSVAANVAHAMLSAPPGGVPVLISALVASIPPLVLLAATHLTVSLTGRSPKTDEPLPRPGNTGVGPAAGSVSVKSAHEPGTSASASPKALTGPPAPAPVRRQLPAGTPVGLLGAPLRVQAGDLQRQGLSNRQIASQLGVHPSTVGRWFAGGEMERADQTQAPMGQGEGSESAP